MCCTAVARRRSSQYLIDNNYVDAVIQLPPDLLLGTTIATCILVLKKSKKNNDVLFIDASAEFKRVGNKNKLLKEHQARILEAFTKREPEDYFHHAHEQRGHRGERLQHGGRPTWRPRTLAGGKSNITELNAEIARIVARQSELPHGDRRDSGSWRRAPNEPHR